MTDGDYTLEEAKQFQTFTGNDGLGGAHDALNRMRRASSRGTGCHLTREMLESLCVTAIGQMWMEDDPRITPSKEPSAEGAGS